MNTSQKYSKQQLEPTKEEIARVWNLIKPVSIAMMTTKGDDNYLHSRPMAAQNKDFDGKTLWFFASGDSPKCREIQKDCHANVTFMDSSKNTFVSFVGTVEICHEKQKMKELWDPSLSAWFPQSLDDPNICLLKFNVDGIEYWDSSSRRMIQLYGMAKAFLTGESYSPTFDANKKLDMTKSAAA
jgi:general stress protein 26